MYLRELVGDTAVSERRLREAKVPSTMLAPRYFHGTKKQYLNSVLAHGLNPPDFESFGRGNTALRPVRGRVYLSPNAQAAVKYGSCLLVINRETINDGDLLPDEDEVGEIFHWIMQKSFRDLDRTREVHQNSPDFIARMELLNAPAQHVEVIRFKEYMKRTLTPNMQRQIIGGEYDWWAKGGKAALKKMPEQMVFWLISLGVHVSHDGPIAPDEAWIVEKPGLKSDGSNLAEVARRLDYNKAEVTAKPASGPPQKFVATFRWIANYPFFGGNYGPKPDKLPQPKYKTKDVTFTAPSEAEARAEAELYAEHTVPSFDYTIVAFAKIN